MIIWMSMVFIVNDQISVIIMGLPNIYVNVCHVTIFVDPTVKDPSFSDLIGSPWEGDCME